MPRKATMIPRSLIEAKMVWFKERERVNLEGAQKAKADGDRAEHIRRMDRAAVFGLCAAELENMLRSYQLRHDERAAKAGKGPLVPEPELRWPIVKKEGG